MVYMPYADPERQREFQREWVAARRKEWFDKNGLCVDCGSSEALQLDHVDRHHKVDHKVWSWAKERREAELAKCVVRCTPCHQEKSRIESLRGEELSHTKLTEAIVLIIRSRWNDGEKQTVLASEFGVTRHAVYKIVHRRSWKHI